jgi:lysophospholipase L1-like esterase
MKNWFFCLSIGLNLILLGVLVFLNDRYGLWAKVQRVALEEGRVPGMVLQHEWNRNYQVRREMFRMDKNDSARVLMLGDSLTAQGEWNAMLGEPLVANQGIDGDTSAGVLARIGDDADFRGDTVVIWIGTNDVLQGGSAAPVAERIMEAARAKAHLKKSFTTESTEDTTEQRGRCEVEQPQVGPKGEEAGATESKEEAGQRLAGQAGAAFSNPSTSELARDSENTSLTHFASGAASALDSGHSTLDLAPEAPNVFVLGIPPMATWVERGIELNATIREINARLAEGADENGYRFIELESVLADENGFLRGDMTSDGVHLSAKGYVAVLEKMKQGPLRGQ